MSCSVNTFGGGSTSSLVAIVAASGSVFGSGSFGGSELATVGTNDITSGSTDASRVSVDDESEMVLLLERFDWPSPKPESDVEGVFSSVDSESGRRMGKL